MSFSEEGIDSFTRSLASKQPVPGGGGASALCGALAVSLCGMVGALTAGKKRYAEAEADMNALMSEAEALRTDFLRLIDADADAFLPLAGAYRLPAETDAERAEKNRVMEEALKGAVMPPLTMMEKCCAALDLIALAADKGAALAVSDAGCAAALCRAALESAALNVLVNTAAMQDHAFAGALETRALDMCERYARQADALYGRVLTRILARGKN